MREVMHDCQKFREDWIDGTAEAVDDSVVDCEDCRSFCEEAGLILRATAGDAHPLPEFSEIYWKGFEARMRRKLVREKVSRSIHDYWKWSAMAAAASIAAVVAWGTTHPAQPVSPPQIEVVDNH